MAAAAVVVMVVMVVVVVVLVVEVAAWVSWPGWRCRGEQLADSLRTSWLRLSEKVGWINQ